MPTPQAYLEEYLQTNLPLGITKKIYIYDKNGNRVDFSDKFEVNGTNRLIDFETVETVVEKDFNHFYSRTGDITVRNNDRFFNKPFPILKDIFGSVASFLTDKSGIINIFKKPGSISNSQVNNRYTYLEAVVELELAGEIFQEKLGTFVLSKILTDTTATALIKTDSLVEIARTPADTVVDGLKNWYIQKPYSFLIREVLKKAYGVYDSTSRQVILPPGFLIPRFLDLIVNFDSAVYSAFGRPPVQLDTNGDGEPDTFPLTKKICRALEYDSARASIYMGIDNELWKFNLNTWIFSLVITLSPNYIIEYLQLGDNEIFIKSRIGIHEILTSLDKTDNTLKTKTVNLSRYDLSNSTIFSIYTDTEYDTEFCYYSTLSLHYYFNRITDEPDYLWYIISLCNSIGNINFVSENVRNFISESPIFNDWTAGVHGGGISLNRLLQNNFRATDKFNIHFNYYDFTYSIGDTVKNLNLPIPFNQTIYLSSLGNVGIDSPTDNFWIGLFKANEFKGVCKDSAETINKINRTNKESTFSISKGYFGIWGQVYSVASPGYSLTWPLNGEYDRSLSINGNNKNIRDIKFTLGQFGLNKLLKIGDSLYQVIAKPKEIKIADKHLRFGIGQAAAGYDDYLNVSPVWEANSASPPDFNTLIYGYLTYPNIEIYSISGINRNLINTIRNLHWQGREYQPLCVIADASAASTFYLIAIAFEILDSKVLHYPSALEDSRKFDTTKFAKCAIFKCSTDSTAFGSFTLRNAIINDKIPGLSGYDTNGLNYFEVIAASALEISNTFIEIQNSGGFKYGVWIESESFISSGTTTQEINPNFTVDNSGSWLVWNAGSIHEAIDEVGTNNGDTDYAYTQLEGIQKFKVKLAQVTLPINESGNGTYSVVARKSGSGTVTLDFYIYERVIGLYILRGLSPGNTLTAPYSTINVVVPNNIITDWNEVYAEVVATNDVIDVSCRVTQIKAVIDTVGGVSQFFYRELGFRLGTTIDSDANQDKNFLPTGDFRSMAGKQMMKQKALLDDVAILEGIYYSGKLYVATLMLKNINESDKDTNYPQSNLQYAIWQINESDFSINNVKAFSEQPKSLTVKNGILFFTFEELGIVGSFNLTLGTLGDIQNSYKIYEASNPPVPDETTSHSNIVVVSETTPKVFGVSAPSGKDRYSFKIPQGKYYLWQLDTKYIPILELADFTGMTCEDVLEKMCEALNWIKGFDENGNFFMVSRNPVYTDPDIFLKEAIDTKYIDITEMDIGLEDIINKMTITPYRTVLQPIKVNIILKKRIDEKNNPNITLDVEQRDVTKKTINLICVRDGFVGISSEDIDTIPLFKWRITDVETEVRVAVQAGASDIVLYFYSIFGGTLVEGGIKPTNLIKFINPTTNELIFRTITAVDEVNNSITIDSAFGFILNRDTIGTVVFSRGQYNSNERVATCTEVTGPFVFKVDTLDNIGIGNILQNPFGIRAIVRNKTTNDDGTFSIQVNISNFCIVNDILKGYWSPIISNNSYEVGGSGIFIKIATKDNALTLVSANERTLITADYFQIICDGLKLESDETSKQSYIDITSASTYGFAEGQDPSNKFLNRPLAKNLAKIFVTENAIPRFKGKVSSIFLPQLKVVVKPAGTNGRLFVMRLQNSNLFPLITNNAVDFYLTSIRHSPGKRTSEFTIKAVKGIGQ